MMQISNLEYFYTLFYFFGKREGREEERNTVRLPVTLTRNQIGDVPLCGATPNPLTTPARALSFLNSEDRGCHSVSNAKLSNRAEGPARHAPWLRDPLNCGGTGTGVRTGTAVRAPLAPRPLCSLTEMLRPEHPAQQGSQGQKARVGCGYVGGDVPLRAEQAALQG